MVTFKLTVLYVGEQASAFITIPAGSSIAADYIVEYAVRGSGPIVGFDEVHLVGDFEAWKRQKEAEGFMFSLPRVVAAS